MTHRPCTQHRSPTIRSAHAPPLPRRTPARDSARSRCAAARQRGAGAGGRRDRRRSARPPLRAEGEARDLPVPWPAAPSQLDLFDYKPELSETARQETARLGHRAAAAHRHDVQARSTFPLVGADRSSSSSTASRGAWVSDLLPHIASIADELCIIRVDAHRGRSTTTRRSRSCRPGTQLAGPAEHGRVGRRYGLGSENEDLPAFVVLLVARRGPGAADLRRLWGSGLPAVAASGRAVPQRRRPGAVSEQSRRACTLRARRGTLDRR